MIKVSRILVASSFYGWLLPDGVYHAVRHYGHSEFVKAMMSNGDLERSDESGVYQVAFDAGWIRLTGLGAEAGDWNNSNLHRLQDMLLSKGVLGNEEPYFLDCPKSMIRTNLDEVLSASNIRDLGYAGSMSA